MTPDRDLMTSMGGLVERARKTWSRLTTSAAAWRARSEGGREDVSIADLQAAEPVRRWRAAAALKRNPLASPEAVASLVVALGDAEEFVRWHAAEALAAQEPGRVFAVLETALHDSDPVRRAGAAEALGKLGGEAATLALKRGIADGEPAVRQAIAAALGQIADPANAETLLPLIGDPEPQVVRAAARALGQVGNTIAACPLAEALVRPGQDVLVRRALAAAVAHIPHPDAQGPLLQALGDEDPQVRAYAAKALGHVGNEEAHGPLRHLMADKSRLIRGTVSDRARRALELLERRGRRQAS